MNERVIQWQDFPAEGAARFCDLKALLRMKFEEKLGKQETPFTPFKKQKSTLKK